MWGYRVSVLIKWVSNSLPSRGPGGVRCAAPGALLPLGPCLRGCSRAVAAEAVAGQNWRRMGDLSNLESTYGGFCSKISSFKISSLK